MRGRGGRSEQQQQQQQQQQQYRDEPPSSKQLLALSSCGVLCSLWFTSSSRPNTCGHPGNVMWCPCGGGTRGFTNILTTTTLPLPERR